MGRFGGHDPLEPAPSRFSLEAVRRSVSAHHPFVLAELPQRPGNQHHQGAVSASPQGDGSGTDRQLPAGVYKAERGSTKGPKRRIMKAAGVNAGRFYP